MKTSIYQVQSFLTMDEYPNYEERQNRGYFLHNISPFQLFNKIGCVKNIKINKSPYNYDEITPGFYQVAIDISKVEINDGIVREINPDAILFVDYPIIFTYNGNTGNKKILYLSNLTTTFSNEYDLIDFLHTHRDELCLDFYDILDVLIIYGKISNKVVYKFFATNE